MQVSSSDHRENHSLPSLITAMGQINKECLLHNVESWESLSLAETSDLVLGRVLVADAAVWRLPGILSLSGILLPVPVPGKNEQSIERFLPCWNVSIWAGLISCQSYQLVGRSCSNPVHIDHKYWRKGRHAGVSQWPLWQNHSLTATLKAEKAWVWQTPQTLVADAAVWRLPGIVPVPGKNEQSIEQNLPC